MQTPSFFFTTQRRRHFTRRHAPAGQAGHTLLELLVVLSLLGACFAAGGAVLARGLGGVEARGAAQDWQTAAAWAQTAAIWQGTGADVSFEAGRVSVSTAILGVGGDLGTAAPPVPVAPNVLRWQAGQGVVVRFVAGTGAPNAAGSLYFKSPGDDYRVTVRMESGLSVRSRAEGAP